MTLGTSSTTAENAATRLLYCGEQFDGTLGMYNLRARFYDPSNGRFNAMDTFRGNNDDPQSLHKYGYTHCDPVNGWDPSGTTNILFGIAILIVLAIAVTGIVVVDRKTRPQTDSVLYEPNMQADQTKGEPDYERATKLLADARFAMGVLGTPKASSFYDTFFKQVESHHIFFSRAGTKAAALGTNPTIRRIHIYLSHEWTTNSYTPAQRALVLLHELRHSIDGADERVAYRAQYIAEVRYRAMFNGLPLPIPPAQPRTVLFPEQTRDNRGYQSIENLLPLSDRVAIVNEINTTGQIADDTWPR